MVFLMANGYQKTNINSWKIDEKKLNAIKIEKGDVQNGKIAYQKYCKNCHGADGGGSNKLTVSCEDFTRTDFLKSTPDNKLYFICFVDKDNQHQIAKGLEKKITNNKDRWSIIAYIKTLAKK